MNYGKTTWDYCGVEFEFTVNERLAKIWFISYSDSSWDNEDCLIIPFYADEKTNSDWEYLSKILEN